MPFIHIRSLPIAAGFDAGRAVRAVSSEFAAALALDERHVTVTWQTLEPDHYASAGQTAATQPPGSHPVLVELFAPDFNAPERVETMLEVAAGAVAAQAAVEPGNVFAEFRPARSGRVFEEGRLAHWD